MEIPTIWNIVGINGISLIVALLYQNLDILYENPYFISISYSLILAFSHITLFLAMVLFILIHRIIPGTGLFTHLARFGRLTVVMKHS